MTKKTFKWPPGKEAEFKDWEDNFITTMEIPANLAIIGVPTGAMSILTGLQTTYETKYTAAPPHGKGSKSGNTARKVAKKAFISGAGGIRKTVAQYIRNNNAVSDELKIELGLMPASGKLTPNVERSAATYPAVQVKSNSPGTVTFTFHAPGSPKGSGKEAGMQSCTVVYILGTTAPATPDACTKSLAMQRSPHTEPIGIASSRLSIYGFPFWVDSRGKHRNYEPMFTCIIT